ncbi:unnamed protein product [Durusdinium trenchii]|uniref:EF-hand domain-containing protein n=1 Tax=Durusdinium trenchii TaxID=1381693 RepID=A0ABP0SPU0_9DINO
MKPVARIKKAPSPCIHRFARHHHIGLVAKVIRMAVALAHSGLGVEIQQLRAEHVPAAQIGLRIEADGKQVPLDSGELRDFRRPPHSVEVFATEQVVETIIFRYPDGSYLTGLDGNPLGRSVAKPSPPFSLMDGEFITKITGYIDTSHGSLQSVRFHSSKGRISMDYGCQAPRGMAFAFAAPPGTVVAAFSRKEGKPCGRIEEAICIAHPSSQDLVVTAEEKLRQLLELPADWDLLSFCRGQRLLGPMGGRQSGTVCAKHRCPEMIQEMQGLFDSTFRKIYTRDRRGAPLADRLKVTDVYRVLNDQVWREYLRHRERLRLLRWNCPALEEQVPNGPATHAFCESLRRMGRSRLPHLDSQVAECWLFHGTSFEAAAGIAENDFRLDLTGSNAGTLYGKGIYLAENVSKSDEYGEGPRGTRPEEESVKEDRSQVPVPPAPAHTRGAVEPLTRHSVMLVCRTLLGKVLYNDEVNPSPDAIQRSCLAKGAPYDSVLGDRRKIHGTFREFVLYHDDQVYPEFIVVYERIYFHERFQDIFGQMVERCRRRQFQGPSAEEEKVLKSLWDRYAMPHQGQIDKWQLLDLLKAIDQPPEDEEGDLDETFREINTGGSGRITWEEFLAEMTDRVHHACR